MTQVDKAEPEFSEFSIHLLRTAQINNLTLSQMADQKASILIGATFVVFSLAITRLMGSEITYATLSLAVTAFFSSMLAVLAVLPATAKADVKDPNFNILFFGHYSAMEEEEWKENLLKQFGTDEAVYRAMMRDIYQNGMILHRKKYRNLSLAYRTFLGGLFVTISIYVIEFALS